MYIRASTTISTMKIISIKHNDKFLGVQQSNQSYLLGFYFQEHAQKVSLLGPQPRVLLKNVNKINIAKSVKVALLDMNMPIYNVKDDIYLDNEAEVAFVKTNEEKATNNELFEMPFEKFIALPYINKFGTILPYEFMRENDEYIMYRANVIDQFYTDKQVLLE